MYIEPAKTKAIVECFLFLFSFLNGGKKEKGETKSCSNMLSWQLIGHHVTAHTYRQFLKPKLRK